MKRVSLEAICVAVLGAAVAFAANALSPRGLELTRNYFPGTNQAAITRPSPSPLTALKEKGLQWIDSNQALALHSDPRFQQQRIAFVDARDEQQYREGHVPGAYNFDPYYPAKQLAEVLPVCQSAEQIVVYCNGGECEDSQFAAVLLRDAGIANQKLSVFVGGISAWTNRGGTLEIGERNSATLRGPKP